MRSPNEDTPAIVQREVRCNFPPSRAAFASSPYSYSGRMITPFASAVPYLVGVGNHEVLWPGTASNPAFGNARDSGGECNVVTPALLPLPGNATPAAPWYATAAGPLALVVMSSEHDFTAGSPQYAFLEAALAAVDRVATPWLIVTTHRPMCEWE